MDPADPIVAPRLRILAAVHRENSRKARWFGPRLTHALLAMVADDLVQKIERRPT